MRIEATVQEMRALLQLAELDAQAPELAPETYRSRRESNRRRVAKALFERYQTLIEAGRYPVVVAIDRGNCSGCHVRLPTIVEYQARRSPGVHTCPHCRRMVYAPQLLSEKPDAAPKKGALPRRGAALAGEQSESS